MSITPPSLDAELAAIAEEFSFFSDWEERYAHLIDLGGRLPRLPEGERTEANRVRGCASQVWLVATATDDAPPRFRLAADSDAHIVRGLIALVLRLYSDRTAQEISQLDPEALFRRVGLSEALSAQRANGLRAMIARIRALAAATAADKSANAG
ncbi:MAG: SufE family protein [Alphaproteobacteria bacterium]|jgi:cysteine desulfuration protein SufE|nr:SufE family protein [Alphaproteobacteria bacterium]